MNLDDPKLTAYALGELDEPEKSTIALTIANSPEAQRFVVEIQQVARALRSQYESELEVQLIAPAKFFATAEDPFWSKAAPLAIAAALALLALIGAIALSTHRLSTAPTLVGSSSRDVLGSPPESSRSSVVEGEGAVQVGRNAGIELDAASYDYIGEHPFVSVLRNPRSSFPIVVNPASYSDIRRSINAGILPPKDMVRIEQMINYFRYDYPQPAVDEPFSMNLDVVSCPWERSHRLVRIGLKGRDAPSDVHGANIIAKDTSIDVEFNPARVGSYRLIGYDRQVPRRENSAEEGGGTDGIVAGYMVTALYELVPIMQQSVKPNVEASGAAWHGRQTMLTAKLRFKKPGNGDVQLIERAAADDGVGFAKAHQDFKFVAAVAEFGMILRGSDYKGNGTLDAVLTWAQEGRGNDANGYRAAFIELVRKAQALKRG